MPPAEGIADAADLPELAVTVSGSMIVPEGLTPSDGIVCEFT
jgi:hypothetical protein